MGNNDGCQPILGQWFWLMNKSVDWKSWMLSKEMINWQKYNIGLQRLMFVWCGLLVIIRVKKIQVTVKAAEHCGGCYGNWWWWNNAAITRQTAGWNLPGTGDQSHTWLAITERLDTDKIYLEQVTNHTPGWQLLRDLIHMFATNPPASRRITIMEMSRHVMRNTNVFCPSTAHSSAKNK